MAKKTNPKPVEEMVDVVDENDRELLVMPLAEAHRQGHEDEASDKVAVGHDENAVSCNGMLLDHSHPT